MQVVWRVYTVGGMGWKQWFLELGFWNHADWDVANGMAM